MKVNKILSLRNLILLFNSPIKAFFFSFIIYLIFSNNGNNNIWNASGLHYFNFLADAFLHGQFHFRLEPPTTHDLILFDNKIYPYWPPFPAILLMPFIAFFGVNFSDLLFSIFLGSLNVSLVTLLLSELNNKKIITLDKFKQGLLVIFFAFGTAYFTLSPVGTVWYLSQLVAVFCVLLAYLYSIKYDGSWAFLFTGIAISAAFATRMHLFLVGIWPAWYLLSINWNKPIKLLAKYIIIGLIPLIIMGLLYFYYNFSRFGNIFDIGYSYHNMSEVYREGFQEYGGFNIHYVPINLYYHYIAYPFFAKDTNTFFMGGSVFLLSPLFFAIFWSFKEKAKQISNLFLGLTIILTNIPILLLMGTGWVQFGPRYTLDFTIPMLILTANGIKNWPNRIIVILVLISIVHYFFGLYALLAST